uniref:Putative reverse transcriptase, RNA-dependent DNA polymerase, Gag-polypeptide of LTR copia-type n=1 Tax=Tanacetum cinerariifolium TaxID=118510 RepID=A0A6L2MVG2_TANCI|nr:putative reverse transcriptase, RNA-dependent DNA polymerase, Gag-polypeptide of LTR copia-type [Tanacetum cinerariifolium]
MRRPRRFSDAVASSNLLGFLLRRLRSDAVISFLRLSLVVVYRTLIFQEWSDKEPPLLLVDKNPLPMTNGESRSAKVSKGLESPTLQELRCTLEHELELQELLTTSCLIDGSPCDGIDMVIKDLDLEPKIDAMVRDFFNLKFNEPYDDEGDSVEIGSKSAPKTSTHNSDDNTIEEAASNKDVQIDKLDTIDITGSTFSRKVISENEYATESIVYEEPAVGQTVRRSSKYQDYVLDKNIKYSINKVVNYSNLSVDNFVFATSINKIHEPTTNQEAVKDSMWIEAMNQEIKALNRNNT